MPPPTSPDINEQEPLPEGVIELEHDMIKELEVNLKEMSLDGPDSYVRSSRILYEFGTTKQNTTQHNTHTARMQQLTWTTCTPRILSAKRKPKLDLTVENAGAWAVEVLLMGAGDVELDKPLDSKTEAVIHKAELSMGAPLHEPVSQLAHHGARDMAEEIDVRVLKFLVRRKGWRSWLPIYHGGGRTYQTLINLGSSKVRI